MSEHIDALLREQLDDEQLALASVTDRNLLVLAPPGSGKTRALVNAAAHRIRNARALTGHEHARVLCLTFGTDAAREMRTRIERHPLSIPANRMWVGNYHALSAHLLRRYGHLIGWPRDAGLLPAPANETVLAEAIAVLGIKGLQASGAARAVQELKGRRAIDDSNDTLHRLRVRYDEILAERHLRDFDDLILHAHKLLSEQPTVRRILHDAYPFVFIDELQDTNLLQLDLLDHLAADSSRVFAVADDDQMIYGWRDAHPENIDYFVRRFAAEEQPLLGNYRCPPRIVEAANAIIVLNDRRRDVLMKSRVTNRLGEVVVIGASRSTEADAIVAEVERAVGDGVPLGEIAILAPHHFKFDNVVTAMDAAGIRFVHAGRSQLAANQIIKLLRLVLRAVAGGVVASSDVADEGFGEMGVPDELVAKIVAAASAAAQGPPRALLARVMEAFSLGRPSNPNIFEDELRLLGRMIRIAIDDGKPSTAPDLAELVLRDWDRFELAALRAEEAVKIMTSFTAKGTEYRVVVLPFLNAGIVPYERRNEAMDWQEARRVFYVAITRALDRVVLIYDAQKAKSVLLETVERHATHRAVV
ncbi:ATP-dependent helicase [Ilumatobacter nonamiensis]|uniref:ATP-dependent helicase n=1 Tax=Ilumatobacter nonamiensis TaxID=467093 RepID=UPI00034C1A7C|nr:ATP-dependent helicase [Ilumatobacter nonamiensis]